MYCASKSTLHTFCNEVRQAVYHASAGRLQFTAVMYYRVPRLAINQLTPPLINLTLGKSANCGLDLADSEVLEAFLLVFFPSSSPSIVRPANTARCSQAVRRRQLP